MLGEGPTQRFDYLFEPLDGDAFNEDVDHHDGDAEFDDRRRWSTPWQTKIAIAAVITATAVATVAMVMLLLRSETTVPVEVSTATTSVRPTPGAPVMPLFPDSPPPAAVPPGPPAAEPPAPLPSAAATRAPAPQPVTTAIVADSQLTDVRATPPPPPAQPTLAPGTEMTRVAPAPATRSPMSVQPEPRQAFPGQAPPEGGDRPRGGLLGGGGLL